MSVICQASDWLEHKEDSACCPSH